MPKALTFALLREGKSDDGLVPHLRELLVRSGVPEVIGSPREYKGTVEERLRLVADEEVAVDIVFVHRDSDSRTDQERRAEVSAASAQFRESASSTVAVVPVQELEAWLLLDEAEIRAVVGKPSGKAALNIPKLKAVEATSSPKEVLKQACLDAAEAKGRRLKEERRKFSERRRVLLERLDIDGPVRQLPAWQRLEQDVRDTAAEWLDRLEPTAVAAEDGAERRPQAGAPAEPAP